MNTPKTAMGELIDYINSNASNWESETDCKSILSMATELLEKEKQMVIDAFADGFVNGVDRKPVIKPEDYYTQTFKNDKS